MNRLIISPHVDDEVLGCSGFLDKYTTVLHCGCADVQKHGNKTFTREERFLEFERIKRATGCRNIPQKFAVNSYHTQLNALISLFEFYINAEKYDMVFIPHPSYNQDHRAVYEAALVALRPHDINHFAPKVLVYEQEHVLFWNHNYKVFNPNYFIGIDIERKLELYNMLTSQVRSFRSPEHLRAMAKVRGGQAHCEYAEAFEVLRWIE